MIKKINKEEIIVPDKLATFQDKITGARTVAFPIVFPSGVKGVCAVVHLNGDAWNPSTDIKKITIEFK